MIHFENTYASLPNRFFERVSPSKFPNAKLIHWNKDLAQLLDIDIEISNALQVFSGQVILNSSQPISTAYAGHQFAHFVPQLGDGRAILLGEIIDRKKNRFDIQLKGAGATPYSRRGDGKLALGPAIREYIVSEAMTHLRVPTTRSLALVSTGETIYRDTELPGAVLTRVASSHIRIGHFEYFASQGDREALRILTNYAVSRHFPEINIENDPDYVMKFFKGVVYNQASLIAKWMGIGFIHGVMNTDNMLISGETIDYGPCAFMDTFNYDQIYSSIDRHGRYSFKNQPSIALWNLTRLAECLLLLFDSKSTLEMNREIEKFEEILSQFNSNYESQWLQIFGAKLGIVNPQPSDKKIVDEWLSHLQNEKLDYTNSFKDLSRQLTSPNMVASKEFNSMWRNRLALQSQDKEAIKLEMNKHNPAYIPRNHQIEKVILKGLTGDFSTFQEIIELLKRPYEEKKEFKNYQMPPEASEEVKKTFCGT